MVSRMSINPLVLVRKSAGPAHEKNSGTVPGFPEIGVDWYGFCLPHVHWVGVQADLVSDSVLVSRTVAHEAGHWAVSTTLMIRLFRRLIQRLQASILETLCQSDGVAALRVPLQANGDGHPIEQACDALRAVATRTQVIEEIFAVWRSLDQLYNHKMVSNSRRGQFVRLAKKTYERDYPATGNIPGFSALYDRFNPVATKLGLDSALALVHAALSTPQPITGFVDLIDLAADMLRQSEPLSDVTIAADVFTDVSRRYLQQPIDNDTGEKLRTILRQMVEQNGDENASALPTPSWLSEPEQPVFCTFGKNGLELALGRPHSAFHMLWIESLRQQLTMGIGLGCPFWIEGEGGSPGQCCGLRCRLEAMWSNTVGGQPVAKAGLSYRGIATPG